MRLVRGLARNIGQTFLTMATSMSRQFRTIAVEGNIASGKSVLLDYFQKFPGIKTYPEPVEKWRNVDGHNLLDLLYQNNSRWSFTFQMYADLTRIEMHQSNENLLPGDTKLMERSLYSGRYCFAENVYRSGNMEPPEYAVLNEYFNWWTKTHADILHIDLIVYLRTSPEVCYQRLLKRCRKEEKAVPLDYLKSLHELYEHWLVEKRYPVPANVVVVDANIDLSSMHAVYDDLAKRILTNSQKASVETVQNETIRFDPSSG